ncbi:pirin family protein [Bacillus sp. FJAT-45350]|uniref:pirin family protein n=1 Tax=Bacillus sp. FJAT-45350 TaxID=2011014 RepID=UPI000BB95FFE|nr:pirin family protein [Bacillus sp. FJAT-45350]
MKINVYGPDKQGVGQFDGGKITEQKPIGFPGDGAHVKRVGPLFYWSWAQAEKAGYIPRHPHEAFEIITYVINGKAEHGDSLGTKSVVGPGGIQVMQTGSGVAHEEGFVGPDMEAFQIWFEPYINEAVRRPPTYNQYTHEGFPLKEKDGTTLKTVIGQDSPVELVADIQMWDIIIQSNKNLQFPIEKGYSLAILAIRGNGKINNQQYNHKDFIILEVESDELVSFDTDDEEVRLIVIKAPTTVDYRLYPK